VTKNAVIGKVHRIGLQPRVITQKPPPKHNPFGFTGPACMWPHGHPGENDFHFCGDQPLAGKPYCASHAAVAYLRPKEEKQAPPLSAYLSLVWTNGASQLQPSVPVNRTPRSNKYSVASRPMPQPEDT